MKLPIAESRHRFIYFILVVLLILGVLIALFVGRYPQPGFLSLSRLQEDPLALQILMRLRLPRVIAGILVGMVLSTAGLVFQQAFANPLVEPGFLGITHGAAFGAAIAIIIFSGNALAIQLGSSLFAFVGLGFSLFLSRGIYAKNDRMSLIFSGIIISALFSSGLGILKYIADPYNQLPEITFWLLGGLWSITWAKLLPILLPILLSLILLIVFRWRLNLLGLDDQVAHSLGFSVKKEKRFYIFAAVIGTALITSIAGIISWVGLIIPSISRLIFGGNMKQSLPGALLLGGIFVLICDTAGRVFSPGEIPLGILTSLAGCLAFLFVVTRRSLRTKP